MLLLDTTRARLKGAHPTENIVCDIWQAELHHVVYNHTQSWFCAHATSALEVSIQTQAQRDGVKGSHADEVMQLANQQLLCQVGSFRVTALLQKLLEVRQLTLQCNPIFPG